MSCHTSYIKTFCSLTIYWVLATIALIYFFLITCSKNTQELLLPQQTVYLFAFNMFNHDFAQSEKQCEFNCVPMPLFRLSHAQLHVTRLLSLLMNDDCQIVNVIGNILHRTVGNLAEFLAGCDYICNVLPSTTETQDLLSGDALSCCKSKVTRS